jgi:hypothetical protein
MLREQRHQQRRGSVIRQYKFSPKVLGLGYNPDKNDNIDNNKKLTVVYGRKDSYTSQVVSLKIRRRNWWMETTEGDDVMTKVETQFKTSHILSRRTVDNFYQGEKKLLRRRYLVTCCVTPGFQIRRPACVSERPTSHSARP